MAKRRNQPGWWSIRYSEERYMKKLMRRLLRGDQVELTESSPEVLETRTLLEKEGVWIDPDTGDELDLCGSVFWNQRNTVAVIVTGLD
jgi:hypothetical protein